MNVLKTIYITRHGSTAYNDDDLLQGTIDVTLSEKGIRESEQLAERLKDESIDVIYHSPLTRTRQTAEIVNRYHQAPLNMIEGFIEIDMGDWEGQDYSKVMDRYHDLYQQWLSSADAVIPGGESYNQVFKRAKPGTMQILASQFSNILIVAHAMVNRAILGNLLDMHPLCSRRFRTYNCSLSKLLVYGTPEKPHVVVEHWNNTAHLKGI
jgi:broad specificity phosphatase PhoE